MLRNMLRNPIFLFGPEDPYSVEVLRLARAVLQLVEDDEEAGWRVLDKWRSVLRSGGVVTVSSEGR